MGAGGWTDDAAIDAFLEWIGVGKGKSRRTVEAYGLALKRFKGFMAPGSILGASEEELEAFSGLWLSKKGVVAQSRKPYISALRGFYGWATLKGLIELNPSTSLGHPKTGKRLPNTISLRDAERLLCAPDLTTFKGIRDCAMLHVLAGCGIRVSGLVMINEGDLGFADIDGKPRLTLRVTEKGDRDRMLPLPAEAAAVLQVYLGHEELAKVDRDTQDRDGRPDKVLFVSVKNTTVRPDRYRGEERRLRRQAVHDLIQGYGLKLGIAKKMLHPHALRHLFGSEMTEGDVPTAVLQKLMGHQDPKSTSLYVELAMRMKARRMDAHSPLAKIKTPVSELLKRLPR